MFKWWEFYQDHDEEIKELLKQTKSLNPAFPCGIRKWGQAELDGMRKLGHTTLDFFTCRCNTFPGQHYEPNRIVPNTWRAPDMEEN